MPAFMTDTRKHADDDCVLEKESNQIVAKTAFRCQTNFFLLVLGLLRTIAMNLNLGICREEEKAMKKHALIDYMLRHLKVAIEADSEGSLINPK